MDSINGYIAAIIVSLVFSGCATSGGGMGPSGTTSTSNNSNSSVQVNGPMMNLTDYLTQVPGVRVSGSGPNATISIRGVNTFMGNPYPLFVVDGQKVGRSFSTVYQLVSISDVTSIDVLKGADAAIYGTEGGNGVILINY